MPTASTPNTTQKILEQVAGKIGHPVYNPVSNRTLGQILDISHTHIKRLRDGDGVLARDGFVRACKFLELTPEQIVDYTLALDGDATQDAGLRSYIRDMAKGIMKRAVVKSSASILLGAGAMFGHIDDARASENTALARTAAPAATSEQCILW
jgi:DNA-binding Xre family transcriptional regulator